MDGEIDEGSGTEDAGGLEGAGDGAGTSEGAGAGAAGAPGGADTGGSPVPSGATGFRTRGLPPTTRRSFGAMRRWTGWHS